MNGLQNEEKRRKLRHLLRTLREERGVTQVELATRLGVPQSVVSKYEAGDRQVDFVEVEAICDALGVSLRTLLRRWETTPANVGSGYD